MATLTVLYNNVNKIINSEQTFNDLVDKVLSSSSNFQSEVDQIWDQTLNRQVNPNYWLVFLLQTFLIYFFFDLVVLQLVLRRFRNPKSGSSCVHWYYMHVFGNILTCWYALPHIVKLLSNPVDEIFLKPDFEFETPLCVFTTHMFHIVAYRNVLKGDYIHHIVFAFAAISQGIFSKHRHGFMPSRNSDLYCFQVSGLWGGFGYFLLALEKEGVISKLTRIRYYAEMNVWLRAPCILATWTILTLQFIYKGSEGRQRTIGDYIAIVVLTFASYFNANYYSREVLIAAGNQNAIIISQPKKKPTTTTTTTSEEESKKEGGGEVGGDDGEKKKKSEKEKHQEGEEENKEENKEEKTGVYHTLGTALSSPPGSPMSPSLHVEKKSHKKHK